MREFKYNRGLEQREGRRWHPCQLRNLILGVQSRALSHCGRMEVGNRTRRKAIIISHIHLNLDQNDYEQVAEEETGAASVVLALECRKELE